MKINYQIYLVADSEVSGLPALVEKSIKHGVGVVQYRNKKDCLRSFLQQAKLIQEICQKYQVPFIINDNLEAAIELKSDGLHIGQNDITIEQIRGQQYKGIVGLSCQTYEQVRYAIDNDFDYVGVGSILKSKTKPHGLIVKKSQLEKISKITEIPIVLIGGMNSLTVPKYNKKYGFKNFAFVSYILKNTDMINGIELIKQILNDH